LTGGRLGGQHRLVDPTTRANRTAWEAASQKHVREYEELLAGAASGSSLTDAEHRLLQGILCHSPEVVHLQSGHGLDDVALVRAGAKSVLGVDFSQVATRAAQRRAAAWAGRLPNSFALLARRRR
jgi:predicted nicotinamide N-methyase